MGYRVHQWSPTDSGVAGRSSAIGARKPETPEDGLVWAKHCAEEIGSWGVFLPQLYELYKAVLRGAAQPVRRPQRRAAGREPALPTTMTRSRGHRGARTTTRKRPPSHELRRAAHHDPAVPDPALDVHAVVRVAFVT